MNIKFCLLAASVMLIISCVENKGVDKTALKVRCYQVQSSDNTTSTSSYPGKVSAASEVNLSFRVAGVIDKIDVKEGDFVRKDQVVAYMDNRDYKLQLEATQAEYDAIEGEVARIVALYRDQSVSKNDYEKAVNGLKQITAKLASHRNAYEDTNLKAPFDGYIQRVNFDKGEAVSAGMPVISLISSNAPEIVVNIPANEYIKRKDLLSATATLASYPGKVFNLKRVSITHKANLNQLYEVRFKVEHLNDTLPSVGLSAMVSLTYKDGEMGEFVIPVSAIVEQGGESCVWQVVDGKTCLRAVEVVRVKSDGTVIIANGLNSGDIIVTAGTRSLKGGQNVEPLEQPSKSNIGNIL